MNINPTGGQPVGKLGDFIKPISGGGDIDSNIVDGLTKLFGERYNLALGGRDTLEKPPKVETAPKPEQTKPKKLPTMRITIAGKTFNIKDEASFYEAFNYAKQKGDRVALSLLLTHARNVGLMYK